MKEYNINKLTSYLHRVNDRLEKYVTAIRADIEQNVVSWPECEQLAEAANDLWNFLQDAADGIKQPTRIQTDEQWPTI